MSRTHTLDLLPNGVELFAEEWALGGLGASRATLAENWGVNKDTITRWTQRDDVKQIAGKFLRDQILRSKRKIDAKLAQAIEDLHPVDDFELLLKARKELAPDVPRDTELSSSDLIALAFETLDENPELAEKLQEAVKADAPA